MLPDRWVLGAAQGSTKIHFMVMPKFTSWSCQDLVSNPAITNEACVSAGLVCVHETRAFYISFRPSTKYIQPHKQSQHR